MPPAQLWGRDRQGRRGDAAGELFKGRAVGRRFRASIVGLAVLGGTAGCSGSSDPSWVDASRTGAPTIADADDAASIPSTRSCDPLGLEAPTTRPTPVDHQGESTRGIDNDPYTATGARQLPGPDMTLVSPPGDPIAVVVARPADPDQHVAARQADGVDTGPVPPPKVIGRPVDHATSTTTTEGDTASPDPSEPEPCIPLVGP